MKLSMWMIVNRLYNFDLEFQIQDQSPICLKSARRTYATDCVYVYQSGNDAIAKSGDDFIRIKEIDALEAVEILQGVFDYYADWEMTIRDCIDQMDFQSLIDKTWHVFRNPVVLFDADCNVIAMSSRFRDIPIDPEWEHISRFGSSSVKAYSHLKNDSNNYDKVLASYYNISESEMTNCISCLILSNYMICGRINVLEYERKLNYGDIQIVNLLVSWMSHAMGVQEKDRVTGYYSVFQNLLGGFPVEQTKLNRQLEILDWDNEQDRFCVLTACPTERTKGSEAARLLSGKLNRMLEQAQTCVVNQTVVMLFRVRDLEGVSLDKLLPFAYSQGYLLARSLDFSDISRCRLFYEQTLFVLNECKKDTKVHLSQRDLPQKEYFTGTGAQQAAFGPATLYQTRESDSRIYSFYDCAITFLIRNGDPEKALAACHPDIMRMWTEESGCQRNHLRTFQAYLNNERSLQNAAQELYIHRNTLVYRINKILENIQYDLDDIYTRDYMKLSLRVLEIYAG